MLERRPQALMMAPVPGRSACSGDSEASERLDAVLAVLLDACRAVAGELTPFLPLAAARVAAALDGLDAERGRALFPKFERR